MTALWKDGLLRPCELEPLCRNEIDTLLTATAGAVSDRHCADRVWHLTQGNVLFLRQLVEQKQRAGRLVVERGVLSWVGDAAISGSLAELVGAAGRGGSIGGSGGGGVSSSGAGLSGGGARRGGS